MRRSLVVLVLSASLVGLATTGALAQQPGGSAIVEREKGTFPYEFVEEDMCPFGDVTVEGVTTYNFRLREGRNNRQQAFFVHSSYSFTETLSANDLYVTVTGNLTFNEVRAVPLGDGVFQFSEIDAGNVTVRDARGRVLGGEGGIRRGTYTFDTLNDNEPGGELLSEIESTFSGRFDDLDAIICAALTPSEP